MKFLMVVVAALGLSACYTNSAVKLGQNFSETRVGTEQKISGRYLASPLNTDDIKLPAKLNLNEPQKALLSGSCEIAIDSKAVANGLEELSKNILSGYFRDIVFGKLDKSTAASFGGSLSGVVAVSLKSLKQDAKCSGRVNGYGAGTYSCWHDLTLTYTVLFLERGKSKVRYEQEGYSRGQERPTWGPIESCTVLSRLYETNLRVATERALKGILDKIVFEDILKNASK
tara:strand:+ start:308 stop:994 length:687 start_codon:yes stop_codon:yes gene_type:complete